VRVQPVPSGLQRLEIVLNRLDDLRIDIVRRRFAIQEASIPQIPAPPILAPTMVACGVSSTSLSKILTFQRARASLKSRDKLKGIFCPLLVRYFRFYYVWFQYD
jgi:hypothetical protein